MSVLRERACHPSCTSWISLRSNTQREQEKVFFFFYGIHWCVQLLVTNTSAVPVEYTAVWGGQWEVSRCRKTKVGTWVRVGERSLEFTPRYRQQELMAEYLADFDHLHKHEQDFRVRPLLDRRSFNSLTKLNSEQGPFWAETPTLPLWTNLALIVLCPTEGRLKSLNPTLPAEN